MNYFENRQNVIKESKKSFLYESSLHKLLQHYEKEGFVIISADRCEKTRGQNSQSRKFLKSKLTELYKKYSIGYIPLIGAYVEVNPDTQEKTEVEELSFLVVYKNSMDWFDFLEFFEDLRDTLNQNSILVCHPDHSRVYYFYNKNVPAYGRVHADFNRIVLNVDSPYYSELLKGGHNKVAWVFKGVPVHNSFSSMYTAYLSGEISHSWKV